MAWLKQPEMLAKGIPKRPRTQQLGTWILGNSNSGTGLG